MWRVSKNGKFYMIWQISGSKVNMFSTKDLEDFDALAELASFTLEVTWLKL